MTNQRIQRRAFLGSATLASVAGSLEVLHAAAKPGAHPRNIVFMVADGMSPSVLPLAESFSHFVRGKGLVWRALTDRPEAVNGIMDMASLNSVVTDSSAASSSWGSGCRIFNGALNVLPDGTKLTPIAAIARDRGKRVGLVTTTTVTHATPAGFAAVQQSRNSEDEIATQYAESVDVVLGGGLQFFSAAARTDKLDAIARYTEAGFAYTSRRDELQKALRTPPRKLLGLFSKGMVPYGIDRRNDPKLSETVPSLAQMTSAALDTLKASPAGFLLQVESGRVDHAAHNNDPAALLWEQIAMDEAIEVVLRFAERHPETLVVITADHGNGNPAIGGGYASLSRDRSGFGVLAKAKSSFEVLLPKLKAAKDSPSTVADLARDAFGFDLTKIELDAVVAALGGAKGLSLNSRLDKPVGILGQAVGNHTGVTWVSTDHTSDYTLITALGPGRERFAGYIRNTQCFEHMTDFMGSRFRNPAMKPAAATAFLRTAPRGAVHWV